MKQWFGWKAVVALAPWWLSAAHAGPAQDAQTARPAFLGQYLQQARVIYPLASGDWIAEGEHRFEQAASGASVRYRNARLPDARMDVYFYPGGPPMDPDFSRAVTQTVAEIETLARERAPDGFVPGEVRTFAIPDPAAQFLGEHAIRPRSYVLAMAIDGVPQHSALAITSRDLHFIKLRYSVPSAQYTMAQARAQAEAFLAQLMAQVAFRNTGECFRPLAPVAMPQDASKPEDILASTNEGTEQELWVTEDKVYLTQTILDQPAEAARATSFGQALHDAIRDRCVAPEDMEIAVPEGMREMRFEYGSPRRSAPRRLRGQGSASG